MKKLLILFILFTFVDIRAGQLVEVQLENQADADFLNDIQPFYLINIGNDVVIYLDDIRELKNANIKYQIIKDNIQLEDLSIASPQNSSISAPPDYIYKKDNFYITDKNKVNQKSSFSYLLQLQPYHNKKIKYIDKSYSSELSSSPASNLDSLISLVEEDSLSSYLHRLEAFTHRLAGTDSSRAARDWIAQKFISFGYDSVMLDPFTGYQLWDRDPVECYNVIAYKIGTKYPDKQIIIGAHYDAVPDCPGADDNGSGTAAVLELARIFKDIETEMTFIFITFDSEESWLWGSYHYADSAYNRGDDIVLMINPDMIGHFDNSNEANLYHGDFDGYAKYWSALSDSLVNISGVLSGSTASDHFPFQENGYDVIFVQERNFSTHYHQPSDSTTYINFEYMTRMTKGIAATAFSVNKLPPPIKDIAIIHPGDGQSLILSWEDLNNVEISEYHVYYYPADDTALLDSIIVPATDTTIVINELTENVEYSFYVTPFNFDNIKPIASKIIAAAPSSIPYSPVNFTANPVLHAIDLTWQSKSIELDFSHFEIFRDNSFLTSTIDTFYRDDDAVLGPDYHEYSVFAVDTDDNKSITTASTTTISRAATLVPDRILAINRSNNTGNNFVDEIETGILMRDALNGYTYDYFSDTSYYNETDTSKQIDLFSLLDYGNVIIGAEGGMYDDVTMDSDIRLSETLRYYYSIGGKILIFGRFGNYNGNDYTLNYTNPGVLSHKFYKETAGLTARVGHSTEVVNRTEFTSEMIGAKSQKIYLPDLIWDSTLTQQHTIPFSSPHGIPFTTYAVFEDPGSIDLLYTFDSWDDNPLYENKPVAWIKRDNNSEIIMIDIPLSFMERSRAIEVLQIGVTELFDSATDVVDDNIQLPENITLSQNYPNPFNPTTIIRFSLPSKSDVSLDIYNILGQKVKTLADYTFPAGTHTLEWDGTNQSGKKVSSGIYLYRLQTDENELSKKMLLIK